VAELSYYNSLSAAVDQLPGIAEKFRACGFDIKQKEDKENNYTISPKEQLIMSSMDLEINHLNNKYIIVLSLLHL
jgi:hypothetical protein